MPDKYRAIDFSKKSIVTLKGGEDVGASGCGLASIYDNLAAIFEWNKKLYVLTKAVIDEALYPMGFCRAVLQKFTSILILDYAKDLPVEFIEIP